MIRPERTRRPRAGWIAVLALPLCASCSFVESVRTHSATSDATARVARWAEPNRWTVFAPKLGIDFVSRSGQLAGRAAERLVGIPGELGEMADRAAESTAVLGAEFDPRGEIRALTTSLRALPERFRLGRGWPSDATDPNRDVTTVRPAAAERRSRLWRIVDRVW